MLVLWSVVKIRTDDVYEGVIEDSRDLLGLAVRFVFGFLLVVGELKGLAGSSKQSGGEQRFHKLRA
jgi:hypothetical protein